MLIVLIFFFRKFFNEIAFVEGINEADMDGALLELADFLLRALAHAQDDVGRLQDISAVGDDRSGFFVIFVGGIDG